MTRILLADDHLGVRRALRRILESETGWEICAEAADGEDAVELADQHRPDVAILDLIMPRLDGLGAMRRIHAILPDCQIAIVTMHATEALIREAIAAGATVCLSKTDAEQHLVPAVRALIEKRPYFPPAPPQDFAAG